MYDWKKEKKSPQSRQSDSYSPQNDRLIKFEWNIRMKYVVPSWNRYIELYYMIMFS